jgi:hypothetical protein
VPGAERSLVAFDDAKKFLRGDPGDPLPQAFTNEIIAA